MRHEDWSASPFDNVKNGADSLVYPVRVLNSALLNHIMVDTKKHHLVFHIGILQKWKLGIDFLLH
jgi:hypothetical protein